MILYCPFIINLKVSITLNFNIVLINVATNHFVYIVITFLMFYPVVLNKPWTLSRILLVKKRRRQSFYCSPCSCV
jgi:hypothetical protein